MASQVKPTASAMLAVKWIVVRTQRGLFAQIPTSRLLGQ
jgi:hypothetical protein